MDWYRHDIGDYDADTLHLSAFEDGVYSRLLRWYYREERPLPDGDQAWASVARIGLSEWLAVAPTIRAFFVRRESRVTGVFEWHHKRCNREIRHIDGSRKRDSRRQAKRRKYLMDSDPPKSSRVSHATRVRVEEEVEELSLSTSVEENTKTESADKAARVAENANAPDPLGSPALAKPVRVKRPKVERHPMPATWVPSAQTFEVGRKMGLNDDEIGAEAAVMRCHYLEGRGCGEERPGWDATFINWLKRCAREIIARRASNGGFRSQGHNGRDRGFAARIADRIAQAAESDAVQRNGRSGVPVSGLGVGSQPPAPAKPGPIPGFGDGEDDPRLGAIDGDFRLVG